MFPPTPVPDLAPVVTALSNNIPNGALDRSAPEHPAPAQEAQRSLFEVFSSVPDPRSRHGRRHPLNSLLAMLVVALCSGANHVKSAVIFGRERKYLRKRLGFTHRIAPSQSTYTRLFQRLDLTAFQQALTCWLRELAACWAERRTGPVAAAVDGKALRGSQHHLLHTFVQDLWLLLDLREVGEKQNEISAFQQHLEQMLENYPFISLFTFDALFAQHTIAKKLTAAGRRGLFQIKDNQRETSFRLQRWFYALPKAEPDFETTDLNGDHIVTRRLWVACAPPDVRELWPEARQIVAVRSTSAKRRPQAAGRGDELHLYLLTGPQGQRRLSPKRLAGLIRGHWGIENRLHHILDRTYEEDRQRPRVKGAALILAWLRRLSLGLLYRRSRCRRGACFIPEKRHILCAHPFRAAKLVMGGAR